jgi:hypothetical protein
MAVIAKLEEHDRDFLLRAHAALNSELTHRAIEDEVNRIVDGFNEYVAAHQPCDPRAQAPSAG